MALMEVREKASLLIRSREIDYEYTPARLEDPSHFPHTVFTYPARQVVKH